jgi:hypothetical protein
MNAEGSGIFVGHPVGAAGRQWSRQVLDRLELPEPWAGNVLAALRLIDVLDAEIDACKAALPGAAGSDGPGHHRGDTTATSGRQPSSSRRAGSREKRAASSERDRTPSLV